MKTRRYTINTIQLAELFNKACKDDGIQTTVVVSEIIRNNVEHLSSRCVRKVKFPLITFKLDAGFNARFNHDDAVAWTAALIKHLLTTGQAVKND